MAETGTSQENDMAGNGDMKAHESTYFSVMALLKWGAVACFVIGFGVILIIAR